MAKIQQRNSEDVYRAAFAEHAAGTSLDELARRLGVKRSTLKWWKSRLKRRDEAQAFLPVRVVAPPASSSPRPFEVEHPSGALIRVPPGFGGDDLARLIRALEHARC